MCLRLAEGDTGELNETLNATLHRNTLNVRGGGDCLVWYRGQRPGGLEADFDRHSATHYTPFSPKLLETGAIWLTMAKIGEMVKSLVKMMLVTGAILKHVDGNEA